jgi:hypothetical protein
LEGMATRMVERDTNTPTVVTSGQQRKVTATNTVVIATMPKVIRLLRLQSTMAILEKSFQRQSLRK